MRQRLLLALLIGVAVVGTLGGIAYTNAATNTRLRPANYRAAVIRVLDDRHVDYRDVEVLDGCAPTYEFCQTYSGSVRVLATTAMLGRIECRERWTTCTITVRQAEIVGTALDDTIDPIAARWNAFYWQLMLWPRSASHGFTQHD